MVTQIPQILCIGQSDSSAGTGIQADLKTAQAFGVYASNVVTAVAAQNTQTIDGMHIVPEHIVKMQIDAVMNDMPPSVIKAGMLASTETIRTIGEIFDSMGKDIPHVVVDPVMTNRTGSDLLGKEARDIIKRSLLLYADILTPNIEEASELTGMEIRDIDEMCHAAEMLRTLGPRTVILKGGALSLDGDMVYDVFADDSGTEVYKNKRMQTRATHGAGSTLSTGLAACLAQGMAVREAFFIVRAYLNEAIASAAPIGQGFGPLNHSAFVPDLADRLKAQI